MGLRRRSEVVGMTRWARCMMRFGKWRALGVLAVAAVVAACGSDAGETSAPGSTEAATTLTLAPGTSARTAVATRTPGAEPMPAISELQPGVRYEPADVTPAISLEVPDAGWKQYPLPPFPVTDLLDMGKNVSADGESDAGVSVLRVTDVWTTFLVPDPVQAPRPVRRACTRRSCRMVREPPLLTAVRAISDDGRRFPGRHVHRRGATTAGGGGGYMPGARCTILFSLESTAGYTAAFEGETSRYWVVDAGPERFVVAMGVDSGVDPAQRDALTREGEAVVASIQIR